VITLRRIGKPDHRRSDSSLLGVEKTTRLVTTGIYGYIRHPLYGSLLYGTWGVFFKRPDIISLSLTIMAVILLIITARIEETENIRYFGEAYLEYRKKTKMFVPYIL
jgi:protein-S-isoprenylcysteine O-methyltransferase Ste14